MTSLWKLRSPSPLAPQLARETGLTLLEAQLLINRGIVDTPAAAAFLEPRLSGLSDPMLLTDMDRALDLIVCAMENRDPVTIFGDFDADGLTATALLLHLFSTLDVPASYYIPNRLTEGYSLNPAALRKIAAKGGGLLITVDCGTSNRDEIALAGELGLRVVVTDHHRVPEDFRPPCPVINPHRPDSPFPFRDLAGVGVAFFLAAALRRALRERGWFATSPEPDLRDHLDLVALGTVADMVPLVGQNRILVRAGLEKMQNSRRPGIMAIREIAEIGPEEITSLDLAFRMAPRLNASGRLGDAETGLTILTTDEPDHARVLAKRLNAMNGRRQIIEQEIIREIEETEIFSGDLEDRRALCVSGKGWHKGVLGIVASRLANRYHRPALVLNIEDGLATGSGRSIEGFDLYRALEGLEHLLVRFGGHSQAAGLTLRASNLDALAGGLEGIARDALGSGDLVPSIDIDAEVTLPALTLETVNRMESLSPFGSGNPEPVFSIQTLEVMESMVVGERHLKLKVRQGDAMAEAIGFGLAGRHPVTDRVDMVFSPTIDRWQGHKKIQLRIIDLEEVGRVVT
jgi:single-stranded-DNA-specific exonuclease